MLKVRMHSNIFRSITDFYLILKPLKLQEFFRLECSAICSVRKDEGPEENDHDLIRRS